ERSERMPWYDGPPLLERLETVPVEPPAVHGARLPVQMVLRGDGSARWAAGRLAAGTLRAGDEVVVLPSGVRSRVAEVRDAEWPAADGLALNDIARVRLRLGGEIAPDAYERCHATGAFILVDEATNDTVAAGMVR